MLLSSQDLLLGNLDFAGQASSIFEDRVESLPNSPAIAGNDGHRFDRLGGSSKGLLESVFGGILRCEA